MNKISTPRLMKLASFGGVFVLGNALLMRHLTQKRLQQSPYYIQASEIVMSNSGLVNYFGEPLKLGVPDFGGNPNNYSTPTEAKLEIPIKGETHEGSLHLVSVRKDGSVQDNDKYAGWTVKNLEVTVKDKPNQKLVLVEEFVPTKNAKKDKVSES